jgi:hypothetical protein
MTVNTSQMTILVDGRDIQDAVDQNVIEVVVDQHTHLPAMFTIRIQDPDLKAIDEGPFDLAKEVVIESGLENGDRVTLMEGEVTAPSRWSRGIIRVGWWPTVRTACTARPAAVVCEYSR